MRRSGSSTATLGRRRHRRRRRRLLFRAGGNLAAKCRHLDDFRAELHVRQAEPPPDDPAVPEQPLHLVRVRRRADVEILRRPAEKQIAYAAAHEIRDVVELLKPVEDLERVRVDVLA